MADAAPEIGTVIGDRYRLEKLLGEGSFGTVWRASTVENAWGDRFALKLLHANLLSAAWIRDRFLREAEISSTLRHPNIARAVAWSAEPPQPYLALEYVDGTTLSEAMQKNARLERHFTLDELETLTRQLFDAVAYAHEKGIVHRDLKPKNMMLVRGREDGELVLKVLDFGISKVLTTAGDATTIGRLLGTPAYMAPEQIKSATIDVRTDVFALGTILFELVTLERAWVEGSSGASHVEIFARVINGPRPRPTLYRQELSPELDRVIAKATAIDPAERFQTAVALGEAFAKALRAKPGEVSFDEESTAGNEEPAMTYVRPQDLVLGPEPTAPKVESIETWPGPLATESTEPGKTLPPKAVTTLQLGPPREPRRSRGAWIAAIGFTIGLTSLAAMVTILWIERESAPIVAKVVPNAPPAEPEPKPLPRVEAREPEPAQPAPPVEPPPPPAREPEPPPAQPKPPPAVRTKAAVANEAPPPKREDPLQRKIDALRAKLAANPSDAAAIGELSEAILRAARELDDSVERTAIERRATASAAVGDVAGLEACARDLAKAKRRN